MFETDLSFNIKLLYAKIIFYYFGVWLCQLSMVIRFNHPRHNGQWPPTSKDFTPLLVMSYLNSWERASISKQGNYYYHFYNVFVMTRTLTGDWTGTSRTGCQHSTTTLSRRRCLINESCFSSDLDLQMTLSRNLIHLDLSKYLTDILFLGEMVFSVLGLTDIRGVKNVTTAISEGLYELGSQNDVSCFDDTCI